MLKQKASRLDFVCPETWAMYEVAWAELIRTQTDGEGNAALLKSRDRVDFLEEIAMRERHRRPKLVTIQDVFDYHAQLDAAK